MLFIRAFPYALYIALMFAFVKPIIPRQGVGTGGGVMGRKSFVGGGGGAKLNPEP